MNKLGLMNVGNRINGFQFNYQTAKTNKVSLIICLEWSVFIEDIDEFLTLIRNIPILKFHFQRIAIGRFQKSWSQLTMNSHRCTNDSKCLFVPLLVIYHIDNL